MSAASWQRAATSRFRVDGSIGTPFHTRTAALNTTPWIFNWDICHVPDEYVDMTSELKAIRTNVAMGDMSPLTKIEVSGPDAPDAVNYLMTRDATKLEVGQIFYTPMCNQNGHTITPAIVMRTDPNSYRFTPRSDLRVVLGGDGGVRRPDRRCDRRLGDPDAAGAAVARGSQHSHRRRLDGPDVLPHRLCHSRWRRRRDCPHGIHRRARIRVPRADQRRRAGVGRRLREGRELRHRAGRRMVASTLPRVEAALLLRAPTTRIQDQILVGLTRLRAPTLSTSPRLSSSARVISSSSTRRVTSSARKRSENSSTICRPNGCRG